MASRCSLVELSEGGSNRGCQVAGIETGVDQVGVLLIDDLGSELQSRPGAGLDAAIPVVVTEKVACNAVKPGHPRALVASEEATCSRQASAKVSARSSWATVVSPVCASSHCCIAAA